MDAGALATIEELLLAESASQPDGSRLAGFRQRFPNVSLTRCDLSDIDSETPFRVFAGMSMFLVDSSDHCSRITSDPARATGIVVARHNLANKESR
ncbi:MAG: hypothetical protein ACLP00_31875 [Terracidiphilus sp.]